MPTADPEPQPDWVQSDSTYQSGFDIRPDRPFLVTGLLFVVVVALAGAFAHWFRESLQWAVEAYSEAVSPPAAAHDLSQLKVFVVVASTVGLAATIGDRVANRWSGHIGVEAVAASARGEGRKISLVATGLRVVATWIASSGLVSIGRESAIVETGGAVGAVSARRLWGRGDTMAAAGIAAAFAAAYHAPLAAFAYVQEHLGVRHSRRALWFVLIGAAGGHLVAGVWLGGKVIFPPVQGSRWSVLWLGLVSMLPAVLAARIFLEMRVRLTAGAVVRRTALPRWFVMAILSVVAGAAVALFPNAAGNGMDALSDASTASTLALGLALLIGKFVGTSAALGAGAPGGVLTPTISISAGAALLTMVAAQELGMIVEHPWNAMVAAMAIGMAVGLRSPIGAVLLIPELLGDYWLIPFVAVIVAVAWLVDGRIDWMLVQLGEKLPVGVRREDA